MQSVGDVARALQFGSQSAQLFLQYLTALDADGARVPDLVHVRRFVVDLLDRGESQLLTDIDGDSGMFVKMLKYAEQLDMQDSDWMPSGNALRAGHPALNYQSPDAGGAPARGGQTQTPQSDKKQNDCCFSFACTPATRGG